MLSVDKALNGNLFRAFLMSFLLILLSFSNALAQTGTENIVLYASEAPTKAGNWAVVQDWTAANQAALRYADAGGARLTAAFANPTHYFEMTFNAEAGIPYRLWMRGKADSNSTNNDSAFVQFSGSVNSSGSAIYRISTTSALMYNMEEYIGYGLNAWGWNDSGINGLGPLVYFATSGTQTIRVQLREDGLWLDQIVLSPQTYLSSPPGVFKNDSTILPKNSGTAAAGTVVLWASDAPSTAIKGNWQRVSDATAAGQAALRYPNAGGARIDPPLANPTHYFEMTFNAEAGIPYRLWMRGKADSNSTNNDSAFVQFSGSVNSSGSAVFRIGTTSATMFNLEDCTGCGLSAWGWNDNAFGGMGPVIYFATTGTQTIRVQLREDGLCIDQIVLCPQTYLDSSPGAYKNDSTILSKDGSSTPTNQPPQVNISASATSGVAQFSVGFNSNANDPDGQIVSYAWVFGDGGTSSQVAPWHTYQTAGTYNARLTVTDNSGATASASLTITVSNPPPSSSGTRFKVLQWNVAYGRGTDNIIDHNRQATWMANMNPDLISLNEVPPVDVQRYIDLMRQKTGVTWYYYFGLVHPNQSVGQLILSKYPLMSTGLLQLSADGDPYSSGRSAIRASVSIGGKTVHFFSTHLSPMDYLTATRIAQISALTTWADGFSGARIIAGDFNLWPGAPEYANMTASYHDSWAEAALIGKAVYYPDNPEGRTRKPRVDYINFSKYYSNLSLIEVRMPDQRDLNNKNVVVTVGNSNDWGVRPSDHNFIVSTFEIAP
jgi:endonuclease/exonuclease/phosphatase family metal-dependent hydrolase